MKPKDLQTAFASMLGVETIIRRKNKTEKNKKKSLFLSIINKYDVALTKSVMLESEFRIDLSNYEDIFYNIIDEMIILAWGEDVFRLVAFYFYERLDAETGQENFIVGPNMEQIFIKTPEDLYTTIEKLYPGII